MLNQKISVESQRIPKLEVKCCSLITKIVHSDKNIDGFSLLGAAGSLITDKKCTEMRFLSLNSNFSVIIKSISWAFLHTHFVPKVVSGELFGADTI